MRLLAPAKINLHLRVGPPRADGFHPLVSWMCRVSLFDQLQLETTAGRFTDVGLSLSSDRADLICDQSNLIVKAAGLLAAEIAGREREGWPASGGVAALRKRIPIGAGLGGGSSDGARILLGLNRLWNAGLSVEELSAIGARLGSDVPFFLHGPSSVCRGRGEVVQPIARPAVRWAVLILPHQAIATPGVYKRLDTLNKWDARTETKEDANWSAEPDWAHWTTLPANQLLPLLLNDLERPAFDVAPEIGQLRDRAEQLMGRIVRMSGSGSSLFTLFDEEAAARMAAGEMKRRLQVDSEAVELAPKIEDDLEEINVGL